MAHDEMIVLLPDPAAAGEIRAAHQLLQRRDGLDRVDVGGCQGGARRGRLDGSHQVVGPDAGEGLQEDRAQALAWNIRCVRDGSLLQKSSP